MSQRVEFAPFGASPFTDSEDFTHTVNIPNGEEPFEGSWQIPVEFLPAGGVWKTTGDTSSWTPPGSRIEYAGIHISEPLTVRQVIKICQFARGPTSFGPRLSRSGAIAALDAAIRANQSIQPLKERLHHVPSDEDLTALLMPRRVIEGSSQEAKDNVLVCEHSLPEGLAVISPVTVEPLPPPPCLRVFQELPPLLIEVDNLCLCGKPHGSCGCLVVSGGDARGRERGTVLGTASDYRLEDLKNSRLFSFCEMTRTYTAIRQV
jgi:hypothetical protein